MADKEDYEEVQKTVTKVTNELVSRMQSFGYVQPRDRTLTYDRYSTFFSKLVLESDLSVSDFEKLAERAIELASKDLGTAQTHGYIAPTDRVNLFLEKFTFHLNNLIKLTVKKEKRTISTEKDAIDDNAQNKAKKKRKPIDKATRDAVWIKYMGKDKAEGKCYCCGIRTIHITDFQVGHNRAVAKGGSNNIDNLRPICGPCNRSMGKISIEQYKKNYDIKTANVQPIEEASSDINQIKKDIIQNYDRLSPIDLIHKASIVANLENDEKRKQWLDYELNGYPDEYKQIPEYRRIKVRVSIGIESTSKFFDLREYPIPIRYGGGLVKLWSVIELNPKVATVSFEAPPIPKIKQFLDSQKAIAVGNFNPNRLLYEIDRTEVNALVEGLKQEILKYISK